MDEKFTPGPWEKHIDPDGWFWIVPEDYEYWLDTRGNFVGISETICSIGDHGIVDQADQANAALIAAAPDLYEALDKTVELLDDIFKYREHPDEIAIALSLIHI